MNDRHRRRCALFVCGLGVGGCFAEYPKPFLEYFEEETSGSATARNTVGEASLAGTTPAEEATGMGDTGTGGVEASTHTTPLGEVSTTSPAVPSTGPSPTQTGSTTSQPPGCGNGVLDSGEECDGIDWQSATCETLGYSPGRLACTPTCRFDPTGCVPAGMVLISGGSFLMGSNVVWDDGPERDVVLSAFYIDTLEVTVSRYTECVESGACAPPATDVDCNFGVAGREDHPINCVRWSDADDYCAWAGGGLKRLPTEAEWERAARSTDGREYPWGDEPEPDCTRAVMSNGVLGCGAESTWVVGSLPDGSSDEGALDMAGNVWEWVYDWYDGLYDPYELEDPVGPIHGEERLVRGGGWYHSSPDDFRTSHRHHVPVMEADPFIGFRCVQAAPVAPM